MSLDLENVFGEFISECEEITVRVAECLRQIESQTETSETLDAIYRDVHTLKGSANLYGFSQMAQLAHTMEAALEPCRKKLAKVSPTMLDLLFKGLDLLEKLIKEIAQTKKEPSLSVELERIIPNMIESTIVSLNADFNLKRPASGPLFESLEEIKKSLEAITAAESKNKAPVVEAVAPVVEAKAAPSLEKNVKEADSLNADISQTIRVQISRLDKLMNLIGEMVLVRNQVLQFSRHSEDNDFLKLGKRLDLVTTELQGEVMQTRMQPIGSVLDKFHRVVRDMNKDLGKRMDLALIGADTEVDKSLLEAVKDPLTHLVRNACDHGLESPQERRAAGKPETGKVTIKSFHEGGHVVIEVTDDGRGLDKARILEKAIEKNILKEKEQVTLSDKEIYSFIFEPGFSTLENVTTVSGRGVGMDVVRTNIEKIGGTVEISTVHKQGTTIRLRIPLTLAIVPAMIVKAGENRFAIPQVKLIELVRAQVQGSGGETGVYNQIEYLQGKPMFRMRGRLLPLVSLREVLNVNNEVVRNEVENIAVLDGDGIQFGLIVDEIQDTTDIVVKPLARFLKSLSLYSGATIMGDGSVVLIFDVAGLAKKASLLSTTKPGAGAIAENEPSKSTEIQEFLLFKTKAQARHALALCLVNRLEEFDKAGIEFAGRQPVIRYRDTILPLIFVSHSLNYGDDQLESLNQKVAVMVVQKYGRSFGLVVDEILDVVTSESHIDDTVKDRPGLLGNLVQGTEVIVVIDPLEIIDREFQTMSRNHYGNDVAYTKLNESKTNKFKNVHILFAEDTAFFRKQVVRALEKAGLKVTATKDGKEALQKIENNPAGTYSLLLSDIEMPIMNGFELAMAVRENQKTKDLPLIALTTKFKTADQEEGKKAGFNLYLEKFNSENVLNGIETLLSLEKKVA